MDFINNLKLSARLNILIILLVVSIFSVFGVYLYIDQKNKITEGIDSRIEEHLQNLSDILDIQLKERQTKVNSDLKVAHNYLYKLGEIQEVDSLTVAIEAVNQITKQSYFTELNLWFINGVMVHQNFDIVDELKYMLGSTATIFQKVDSGYLRISTNVMKLDGSRAVGTYIPNDSPVIKTIEKGETYRGRAFVVNDWYLTAYEPITIDRDIKGILYVGVKEKELSSLAEVFHSKLYFQTGYPFLLDKSGKYIIKPKNELKENNDQAPHIRQLLIEKNGKIRYRSDNGFKKRVYFKYYKPLNAYIAVDFYEEEIFQDLPRLRNIFIVSVIVIIFVLIIGITSVTRPIKLILEKLVRVIGKMAKGQMAERIEYSKKDEIGQITHYLNLLIKGLRDTAMFANQMGKGNLEATFKPLSDDDVLGNSLIEMRESLKSAQAEEQKRKLEDEKANWTTKGQAMFGDILRQNNDNLEVLSYEIVRNLVKYTNVNQGAIFLINDEDRENRFLEMKACYAYERKKYMESNIELGEGLVGACFMERKIKYLRNVPEDYVHITSGLGYAPPSEILMVPLNLNEETFGVIELAGFKKFAKYKIDFVEKIGESVASTISSVKINLRTSLLLKKSQEQAEIMKAQEEEMRQNMEELQVAKEDAARQGEQLESITNTVNHTLVRAEYDTTGILLYANIKFLNKLGYSSNSEVEGKHISTFIHEKDKDWFFKIWDKLSTGGRHFEGDMKHVTKQGKDFWSMATYTCVRKADGDVEKILFLGIDTTEQKKQNLDFEWQINALNQTSIKGEFVLDGSLVQWNELFRKNMGYQKDEELKGKTIYDFIYDEDLEMSRGIWKNLMAGNPFDGQIRLDTNKGERWFHATFSSVKDMYGDVAKVIFIGTDITRQKMMEREMKAMKIRHEKTLEGMLDSILTIDENGIIDFFNKAAEELWGYNKSDIIGKNIKDLIPTEDTNDPHFFENYVIKGVGTRREVKIVNAKNEKVSVLLLFSEARVGDERTFTAFIQNIEVELF